MSFQFTFDFFPRYSKVIFDHFLNASTGFNSAACFAGSTPEIAPTIKANNNIPIIKNKLKSARIK